MEVTRQFTRAASVSIIPHTLRPDSAAPKSKQTYCGLASASYCQDIRLSASVQKRTAPCMEKVAYVTEPCNKVVKTPARQFLDASITHRALIDSDVPSNQTICLYVHSRPCHLSMRPSFHPLNTRPEQRARDYITRFQFPRDHEYLSTHLPA